MYVSYIITHDTFLRITVFMKKNASYTALDASAMPAFEQYSKKARRGLLFFGVLLFAVFLLSFAIGRYGVPVDEVIKIFLSRVFPIEQTWTQQMETVVFNIRLPRILLACLVGACLSVAGAAYQGVFQNPMASPDILGASSGAAFGAALAILLGASSGGITTSAFLFSLLTVALVFFVGRSAWGSA